MLLRLVAAVLAMTGVACEDELTCVTVDLTCAPLYAPTWANVHANTILPKCAASGCHTQAASRGGLVLEDPIRAYDSLIGKGLVIPGDVSCSEVTERIYSSSSSLRMPRGSRLSTAEACAVAQWVAAGAPGPVTTAAEAP